MTQTCNNVCRRRLCGCVTCLPFGPCTHGTILTNTPSAVIPTVEVRHAALDSATEANPKTAFGAAKPSPALIPGAALIEMAGVFGLGARKYGSFNWRTTRVEAMTYANAALRHIYSWIDGETIDPESGCSHLAHAMASLGIVLDAQHTDQLIDNRPTAGATARLVRENTKPITS